MSTTSSAKEAARAGSTMALPPYFTTIGAAPEPLDVRQRLHQHVGPRLRGRSIAHEVPMFSST